MEGVVEKSILISVSNDLSNDQRMLRISASLQNAGYRVLLLGRNKKQSLPLETFNFDQKRLDCFFEKGKLFYLELNIRLLFFCLKNSFDIYYAVDLDTLLPMTIAAALKRKKLCYDAHEYFTEVPEVVNRPLVKMLWDIVGLFCIPRTDLTFTVGPALAAELMQHYGRQFEVVKNVPVQRANVNEWPDFLPFERQKYMLYQGALNKGRGVEQLLDLMPEQKLPLLIAGEGDLSEMLRKKSDEMGLSGKEVFFLGMLPPDELWAVTQHAFLAFNLLEHSGKSYYFSLANKFFDYIQASVPCITMDFPEYSAINKQYKVAELIPDLDKEKISNAIDNLAEDSQKYNLLKENCKKAAETYNWQNEEQHLLRLMHGI
ncbi:MAG: glycosyltransferase [Chitinophagales bacterium]